ncbi:MAG: H+/Na+-translocating ferredoxin:NAD+ oxidoreductase subunit [Clostridiales bacterium]|jgi:electron transport complex protein RnfE|nr:H+/Na+-translocating ferredoxin:NAD+ oxidoreductase subunit [Clostridiales bacterium]MDK2933069.1 H+/Na+-translocating ferredoxin:NAD+ oxidoreductase subunit [Clostridiales bacterium]
MSLYKEFSKGLVKDNPAFVQLLGMCPTLAVTTSVVNGIGMGLSSTAVLIGSNVVISLLRKLIPSKVRIPAFIVIIAGFVTLIDMALKAYFPDLSKALGIFIPLIVVNCIILARAEAFASKNSVAKSAADGLGMGLGFTLALIILASLREILGNGTFLGMSLFGEAFKPAIIMILPPGAFLGLGVILGTMNWFAQRKKRGEAK